MTNETKCRLVEVLSSTTFFNRWEILPYQFVKNHATFFLFFWMLQSWQLELKYTISLFSLSKLIFKCLKWKSQWCIRVTRSKTICATFSPVFHRLIYENIIIWITNFSKRCRVTRSKRICATFSPVFHRLIYENIIIWITNFSKRCCWQQKVINPFSLLRKPIEMVTLSDSRTPHVDKIIYFSVKNTVDWSHNHVDNRKSSMKRPIDNILFHLSTA